MTTFETKNLHAFLHIGFQAQFLLRIFRNSNEVICFQEMVIISNVLCINPIPAFVECDRNRPNFKTITLSNLKPTEIFITQATMIR